MMGTCPKAPLRANAWPCLPLLGMLVLGTAAASPAPEQPGIEYVRNDMPCMAELCVGDDATRLAHVPWKPATDSGTGARLANLRMPAQYLDRLQETLKAEPAVLHAIAAHWYFRSFDADSLRLLAELRAVCAPVGVSGRPSAEYVDAEGFRTVVSFEPRAASPGATPTFIVAAVTRYMPVLHKVHSRAIGKEMAARYRGIAQYASESDPVTG